MIVAGNDAFASHANTVMLIASLCFALNVASADTVRDA